MRKAGMNLKKIAVTCGLTVIMGIAAAMPAFASRAYAEYYYDIFGEYPDGNVYDWENDPVYWGYLHDNDPAEYERLNRAMNGGNSDGDVYVDVYDVRWSGSTAKWDIDGTASKYQVKLYRDDKQVMNETTTKKSMSLSSHITKSGDYWFEVRPYSKYGKFWGEWESSDEKYFSASSGNNNNNNNNGNTLSGGPGSPSNWNNRWYGNGDNWQVYAANGNGFITNSWWQDPSTKEWYLIGCNNVPGRESYMSAGLFRDASGNWYLLNPLHDGTYGRMVSGDNNGNYTLNYNGQSIAVRFNKNHDGTYGKIISDVNAIRNVLGGNFEVTFVPPTAQ